MVFTLILILAVTIMSVIFTLENVTMIQITFLGYPVDGSSGLLMLIAMGIGILIGMLLLLPVIIGNVMSLTRQKRRLADFEQSNLTKRPTIKRPSSS